MTVLVISLIVGAPLSFAVWCWARMRSAQNQLQRVEERAALWESSSRYLERYVERLSAQTQEQKEGARHG